MCIDSSISSTENDLHVSQAKVWTVIDRWSIIWEADLSKTKMGFFPGSDYVSSILWVHHMDADKTR